MLNEKIGAVTLTEVKGSPFYYARFRKHGKQVSRSLKTWDIEQARLLAQRFSDQLPLARKSTEADFSVTAFARQSIDADRKRVQRGERSASLIRDGEHILRAYIAPSELGRMNVARVDYEALQDFVDELTDRDLSVGTIKKAIVHVNKALTMAVRRGVMQSLPLMPKVEGKPGVRGWFSPEEYKHLLRECRRQERLGTKVRSHQITKELRFFATFMVNTFIRPGDARLLRHRHVEIVRTEIAQYLRITTDWSKTTLAPIVTMPLAVEIYERLTRFQQERGFGSADDYLFLPAYKNRDFALRSLGRMFKAVCNAAGLGRARSGEARSLYSLRHTAITFRLLNGSVDAITLARAARTSVEMIDRFYARHLTAEMNIEKLQSMRR
jgi:integrase